MSALNIDQSTLAEGEFTARPARPRGPIRLFRGLLDLFSSVWLGVILLALLFIYSSVGSAGAPIGRGVLRPWFILNPDAWVSVAQQRWFEMTEFEWFHWWPFDLIIALICINLVVATLRRIPFSVLNLGVWMIHAGIIILALGSVWYFSTKVEGDAPVNRRRIFATAPGMDQPQSMVALPGNSKVIGQGNDAYGLQVIDIDPHWELLSGDEAGTKAYKVSVMVRSRGGEFIRELIANRPQYTQDLIRNTDRSPGAQPWLRAVKALGKPLVDEALQLSLDYDPQEHFYLMNSRAVYLREVGQKEWVQRPIPWSAGLPRYNDYIASRDDVWLDPDDALRPDPIDVAVPAASDDDPLKDVTFRISRYLRYAYLESRRRPAPDGRLDPAVNVRLQSSRGDSQQYQLIAFNPSERSALEGNLLFTWIDSTAALEKLKTRIDPVIRFRVPSANVEVEAPITAIAAADPNLPFTPIEGTDYSYRVESTQSLTDLGVSLAIIEIRTPERTFKRWVFDDPSKNRDMAMAEGLSQHDAAVPLDTNIESFYTPGTLPPAPIVIIAGPGEHDLTVMITKSVGQPELHPVKAGDTVAITETVSLIVDKYAARTVTETKPLVVPRQQRDRDVADMMSMIRLDIPQADGGTALWLPFHHYAFKSPEEVLRRFPYRPQTITLADGRQIEFMFSRERRPLPASVVLDDFKVATHIGGFTGSTSSIMDWTSVIRFGDNIDLTDAKTVSVNKPAEHNGYWFFQAQWDPPDRKRFEGDVDSRGLNYTVLGVGNRNGVNVQLAGCCIAVLGMIFGFYVKPIIKRKRQQRTYAEVAANKEVAESNISLQPAGAAWKVET